jgi:protein SCO1/2
MTSALQVLKFNAGQEFDVVAVSFDPRETAELALAKRKTYLDRYKRPGTENGWHFLTGKADQIEKVAKAFGFNYKWVASVGQFSHPAAIAVCTPAGKISRYLYGVQFEEQTLRLSLVEASQGKIGTTVDHFILTCFQYDGKQGRYAMTAMAIMRVGGALTALVLGGALLVLFKMESRRRSAATAHGDGGGDTSGGGATTAGR